MTGKFIVRFNQTGWIVVPADRPNDFRVFRSDEPERFVQFVTEKIAGIKVDELVKLRLAEMAEARRNMEAGQ